tara:strand:- start:648 stop:953 length:306 start_codon:yes stop_codon:yes gene_type:complete
MNKPTFTKGPWASEDCTPGESEGLCFAINSEDKVIARTTDGWNEARANARLIAAAPELLAQCKFLEKVLASGDLSATEEGLRNCDTLAEVREILAKVEGEK